jgi:hypothetical protein
MKGKPAITYIRTTWVAVLNSKPIATAFTFKDLQAGVDEYYGISIDPKAECLGFCSYDGKYPDEYQGYFTYRTDNQNGGTEEESVYVYCVDFYPVTRYTK